MRQRAVWAVVFFVIAAGIGAASVMPGEPDMVLATPHQENRPWQEIFPPTAMVALLTLVTFSAFFSASETAFLSIPKPRLRVMRDEPRLASRMVVRMLDHPGRFLTTILVGNMIVNTLIGVILGSRVEQIFEFVIGLETTKAYVLAVGLCTAFLLMFGEITPKVFAVRAGESYARVAVIPLVVADWCLAPIRKGMLAITDFLFRISRFYELRAAPYITDDELKAVLETGPATEADDEDKGRQMIRRILEFHDVTLREVLVPRPDMIALPEDATVEEARNTFREYEYSRMPVFRDDLDHIQGVLHAKDLLPSLARGDRERPVKSLMRKAHFVPETMSIHDFVRMAQRQRAHLAIVVDEYGGTEGIATLEDAIREVVGEMPGEDEEEEPLYTQVATGVYLLDGGLSLDELREFTGIDVEDEEHETIAGFLMSLSDKVLEVGDEIRHAGVLFRVERVDGKRVASVRLEILHADEADAEEGEEA